MRTTRCRFHAMLLLGCVVAAALSEGVLSRTADASTANKAGTNKAGTNRTGASVEVNAKRRIAKMQFKEGLNVILPTRDGYKFGVQLTKGKTPEFVGIAPGGQLLGTTEQKTSIAMRPVGTTTTTVTTCWRCFKDKKGDLHCVEIDCPTDLEPWGGKSKL